MPALKLEDLLSTPTGQQMVAEHEAREQAVEEQKDAKREEQVVVWLGERDAARAAYEALRPEALALVERLADITKQLVPLQARISTLHKYLLKNGYDGEYPVCDLEGTDKARFVASLRYVEQYLRRALLAGARMLVH